jgi:hypothetical protein
MMARTQITLPPETQRLARKRATELGISLAEYVRTLLARDLARPRAIVDPSRIFDLGKSGASNIARNKDRMIGEAFDAAHRNPGDEPVR